MEAGLPSAWRPYLWLDYCTSCMWWCRPTLSREWSATDCRLSHLYMKLIVILHEAICHPVVAILDWHCGFVSVPYHLPTQYPFLFFLPPHPCIFITSQYSPICINLHPLHVTMNIINKSISNINLCGLQIMQWINTKFATRVQKHATFPPDYFKLFDCLFQNWLMLNYAGDIHLVYGNNSEIKKIALKLQWEVLKYF